MQFAARFEADSETDGGFTVTFRDIPEAITQGDTREEARAMAVDALVTALDFYIEDARAVPAATPAQAGEEWVSLPLSVEAKVLLLNEMVQQRLRPADLARKLGVKPQEVTRIVDLHHTTKIDTLAEAFGAVGRRLELHVA